MRVLPESLFSKFLQCQLCQDNFKDPKLLPCRHTFCHRCLERHLLRSTTTTASLWFLCPSCRSITDVPKDGIASFKSNYFVVNLSSALEHCQKRVGCSAGAGAKFVERSGVTVNTSTGAGVVASNVAVSNGAASNAQSKVSKDKINDESELCRCGKNALRFYCDQCAVVACGDCFQDQHVDHSFLLLEERANKDRDTILSVINEGRNGVNRIEEGLQDLARYKRNLRHTRDDVAAKIKKQASLLHDLITVLEEKQLKDVDDVYNKETEKASMIQKYNTDVATMLRTLNDFADNLLKEGTDSHVVLWKNTISKQQQTVSQDAKLKAVSFLKDNPLDMSYKIDAVDLEVVLKQVIGEVQFGKSIDLFDEGLGMTLSKNPTEFISDGDNGNVRVLTNRVHEASLVKSFSAFTDGSQYSPMIVDVAMTSNNDVIVVDKNNKTVKIFAADGGMFCKMYGSECVFGVCMLDGDTIAVTDNTVHMFDMKGRLVKVLRQQPRDSHGIARLGSGQIVVTDCSSRCVYVLSTVGGTIQRIITQRGRQPFRSPKYVAVDQNDHIIISDASLHTVTVLTDRGRYVGEFGTAGKAGRDTSHLNVPCGVAIDRLNNILVCDKLNNRVVLLDSEARFLCTLIDSDLKYPQAVTVDSEGNAVVVEESGKIKIYRYREKNVN